MGLAALMISACANGFIMSSLWAYEREVQDGGTVNRIWSFMVQYVLLSTTFSAVTVVLPTLASALNLPYYLTVGFLAGLNYLGTLCHNNLINADTPTKIKKLPYNLHKKSAFLKMVRFLNANIFYAIVGLYIVPLIYGCFFGFLSFSMASLAMITINLGYQRGFFPEFVKKPYFVMILFVVTANFFGLNSWLTIGLAAASAVFSIWDFIQCHVRGKKSPSGQFPIAKLENSYDSSLKPHNKISLLHALGKLGSREIRITFNHFHEGFKILDKILQDAPKRDYKKFEELFNQLNFEDPDVKEIILNHMTVDQKFYIKTLDEHRIDLELPESVSAHAIKVAYLKREMSRMVMRLTNQSYRDLNVEQIAMLHGYVRHLLNYLEEKANPIEKKNILLNLAMNSGSLCNRGYLETLSGFEETYTQHPLPLKEEIVLMTQTIREEAFRSYYFKVAKKMRKNLEIFKFLWKDLHDYHTYEDFVSYFGSSFYLRNPTLGSRLRSPIQVFMVRLIEKMLPEKFLFKYYYTEKYLLDQIISGKLSALFQRWCESVYPGCYQDCVLDEYWLVKKDDPIVKNLARMMLLDAGIAEFKLPLEKKREPQINEVSMEKKEKREHPGLHFFPRKIKKPEREYQLKRDHENHLTADRMPSRSLLR